MGEHELAAYHYSVQSEGGGRGLWELFSYSTVLLLALYGFHSVERGDSGAVVEVMGPPQPMTDPVVLLLVVLLPLHAIRFQIPGGMWYVVRPVVPPASCVVHPG